MPIGALERVAYSFWDIDNHGPCTAHRLLVAYAGGSADTIRAAANKDHALTGPVLHIIQ